MKHSFFQKRRSIDLARLESVSWKHSTPEELGFRHMQGAAAIPLNDQSSCEHAHFVYFMACSRRSHARLHN